MAYTVEAFSEHHVAAVEAFNHRLQEGASTWRFPSSPIPGWLPKREEIPVHQEYFVIRQGEQVHGAYALKPQAFAVRGNIQMVAAYQLPISEGIVNKRYALVGLLTIKDAMQRRPLLFSLGMGSQSAPVARLLKTVGFHLIDCPFFFRVAAPRRFLRRMAFLRSDLKRRVIADVAALSGIGSVAIPLLHRMRTHISIPPTGVETRLVGAFDASVNLIWEQAAGAYSMIAVRNETVLGALYPREKDQFIRLLILRGGEPIGWAVVLDTPMQAHKQFGDLRVGSIIDCLAQPGEEITVIATATHALQQRGVDLIVSNQLHSAWCAALENCGFLSAPSNFVFAASPGLTQQLGQFESSVRGIHMTRGDGDGPIHL